MRRFALPEAGNARFCTSGGWKCEGLHFHKASKRKSTMIYLLGEIIKLNSEIIPREVQGLFYNVQLTARKNLVEKRKRIAYSAKRGKQILPTEGAT